jgi:hypothetical protein
MIDSCQLSIDLIARVYSTVILSRVGIEDIKEVLEYHESLSEHVDTYRAMAETIRILDKSECIFDTDFMALCSLAMHTAFQKRFYVRF